MKTKGNRCKFFFKVIKRGLCDVVINIGDRVNKKTSAHLYIIWQLISILVKFINMQLIGKHLKRIFALKSRAIKISKLIVNFCIRKNKYNKKYLRIKFFVHLIKNILKLLIFNNTLLFLFSFKKK